MKLQRIALYFAMLAYIHEPIESEDFQVLEAKGLIKKEDDGTWTITSAFIPLMNELGAEWEAWMREQFVPKTPAPEPTIRRGLRR